MGFLNLFAKKAATGLGRLPSGTFTIDRNGRVVASTVPQTFPADRVQEIGNLVLAAFRSAQESGLPLNELVADYSAFKLTARELRGGAMVFLAPSAFGTKPQK